jgi:hypothetical protein
MDVKEIHNIQKNHFSQDKEAHITTSSDELEKYLDKELKAFWKKKNKDFAKKIKDSHGPSN